MEEFKKRLITEKEELKDKITKLDSFVNSDKVEEIKPIQKHLLIVQLEIMNNYLKVLEIRIENL